jgi:phosphoglycolate phosphatase
LIKNLSEGLTGKVIQPRTAIILATLVSSLFFGMLHSINPNASPLGVLNICLAGFLLSAGYLYTGQLALPIGLHISWNFFLGSVFGFPVSGTLWQSGAVIRILQDGPERWTGGAFGPEGGLLGSLTILLGIGVIWFWKGRGKGIDLNLSHYERGRHLTESYPAITSSVLERIREVKHIIWDWNGTLLDDLDHCLDTINKMLSERNLPELTRDSYQNAFDFPVQDYYQRIGFDLDKESFETLNTEFIQAYEKGRPDCSLMDGAKEILSQTTRLGLSQSILSASKSGYLKEAIEANDVSGFFTIIQGQDNHHAAGKMDLAKAFLETCLLHPLELLLVGDTTHDSDIARELGINCILIPNGHQSRKRLENTGYPVIDSLVDLERILSKLASSR